MIKGRIAPICQMGKLRPTKGFRGYPEVVSV